MKSLFESWSVNMKWDFKWWNDCLRVEVLIWSEIWSDEMAVWELKYYYETRFEVMKWLFESWSAIMKQELKWRNDCLRVEVLLWNKSWSDELTAIVDTLYIYRQHAHMHIYRILKYWYIELKIGFLSITAFHRELLLKSVPWVTYGIFSLFKSLSAWPSQSPM